MPEPVQTCCPDGYLYVDMGGVYYDPFSGPTVIINNAFSSPTYAEVIGHCGQFLNKGWASSVVDPIDCPCCPDTFTWSSFLNTCIRDTNAAVTTDPIPCIPCVCTTTPPPPPCDTCNDQSTHTSFAFNPFVKTCTDCTDIGEPRMTKDIKFNAFLPYFMIDPIINFTLDD